MNAGTLRMGSPMILRCLLRSSRFLSRGKKKNVADFFSNSNVHTHTTPSLPAPMPKRRLEHEEDDDDLVVLSSSDDGNSLDSEDRDEEDDDEGSALESSSQRQRQQGDFSGMGRSNKHLKMLYTPKSGVRFECKTCVNAGSKAADVTGAHLSVFALRHSQVVHLDDPEHRRAVALFPQRQTKKRRVEQELVDRAVAQAKPGKASSSSSSSTTTSFASTSTSTMRQASISSYAVPLGDDTRNKLELALAGAMIDLKIAPNSLAKLGPLIDAACAHGAATRFVSFKIADPQTIMEVTVEGDCGLLGQAERELLGEPGKPSAFINSATTSGVVFALDSARDINGRSALPILAMTPAGRNVVAMPHTVRSKNAEYIFDILKALLTGNYDIGDQETRSSTTGRPLSSSNACKSLNRIANSLGRYTFMVTTDHASAEQAALTRAEEELGVLSCGDPSHAAHNIAHALANEFEEDVEAINRVANFFRNHSGPKDMLDKRAQEHKTTGERRANAVTMKNRVPTRFLSTLQMLTSFLKLKKALYNVVVCTDWEDWVDDHPEHVELARDVKETITKEGAKSFQTAELVCAMLTPLLKMCREFDAARVGSLCFVYRYFSLLTESVLACIADPKFAGIVTPELVAKIKEILAWGWERFDFDCYGAAFFLNPYFQETIKRELRETPTVEGEPVHQTLERERANLNEIESLKEQTYRVILMMVRRFQPKIGAPARSQILAEDHTEVVEVMKLVKEQLERFWTDSTLWRTFDESSEHAISPGAYWRESTLTAVRPYAQRLMDACVGSTDVERLHWRAGRIRTKARNLIGYIRCQSLIFLDHYRNSKISTPDADWRQSMLLLRKFETLSDEDEKFLDDFEKRLEAAEARESIEREAATDVGREQHADDYEEEDEQEDELPQRGRARRKASSRFYAALDAEIERNRT